MSNTKKFLKERVMVNVSRLIDEGYQDINIKFTRDGFTINPTRKRRIRKEDVNVLKDAKRGKNDGE